MILILCGVHCILQAFVSCFLLVLENKMASEDVGSAWSEEARLWHCPWVGADGSGFPVYTAWA